MKNKLFTVLLLFTCILKTTAQSPSFTNIDQKCIDIGALNNRDFTSLTSLKEQLKGVEIVLLGEQTHGDGTVFETKIKLIKYLHEEMGFDIIAFESGFYDLNTAWTAIQQGANADTAAAKNIFPIWSLSNQIAPLFTYIQEQKNTSQPLKIKGFDSNSTPLSSRQFLLKDLHTYLNQASPALVQDTNWARFTLSLTKAIRYAPNYKKKEARLDTAYLNTIRTTLEQRPLDSATAFWIQWTRCMKVQISDYKFGTDNRDQQMAENLIWLKQQNPGSKIICWGASSHFIYNSSHIKLMGFPYTFLDGYYKHHAMMGSYIKNVYHEKAYIIGFTTFEGVYGTAYGKEQKIRKAKNPSLELTLSKSTHDNLFLNFKGLGNDDLAFIGKLPSRPLGNAYMKNNATTIMDGIIFNRKMTKSTFNKSLMQKLYHR